MKKAIIILLSLALVLSLAACGEDGGSKASRDNSDEKQSVDAELEKLKELYDGTWINEDPYDSPFTIEVLSTNGIRLTYVGSGSNICNMFYSADDLTSISVSLGGLSLGTYSIDTKTGILSHKPTDTDIYTYTKE